MPDFCSCGAELPPDALFCHKCGKPQRELPEVATEARAPAPAPVVLPPLGPQPQPAPLDFRNPLALKIALLVAMGATVLFFVLPFVNWLAAGFFAAFLYRRRSGSLLNVWAGVRMGWITGLLAFVPAAIMSLAVELPAALSGRLANTYEQQMKSFPVQDPAAIQWAAGFMATGPGVAVVLTFTLITLFIFITFLSMAGGALAAKLGQASPPRGGSSA
ncbi:MAG: zinc ribbon domain-containing protein [Bryobacteraceae bacterium]